MEMRNVSKRQQPDHRRTDNSRRSPTGLHALQIVHKKLKLKTNTRLTKARGS